MSFHRNAYGHISLLYYSYHIMIGLGTILIGVMTLASLSLWRGGLYRAHPLLWLLMLMLFRADQL
jgi:cytochrome d ubiquinol oxidase subunit I